MSYRLNQFKKRAQRSLQNLKGNVQGNLIPAYWWNNHLNFGDLITPALLKSYGLTPQFQEPTKAALASTGSILQRLPENFAGIVLGSGLIEDKFVPLPAARILAVRGKLSRACTGASADTALGDPGLLAHRLLPKLPEKSHRVAIIPHYTDKGNPVLHQWLTTQGEDALVIDVERQPEAVIRDIARCKYVASSSLHGIIIAHALGIPALWLKMSDQLKGGDFKFRDYASALNMTLASTDLEPNLTMSKLQAEATQPDSAILEHRQQVLDGLFRSVAKQFRK